MKRNIGYVVLLNTCLIACAISGNAQSVMAVKKKITIPTYDVLDADPNPIFFNGRRYQGAQGRVYPYPMISRLTDKKVDKEYEAVIFENEFIEVCVLPELGGRIYYAKDKTNDYYFIYYNRVVKPALIGMTGAWISGGVEWNIPHHHRATSFMPVDYRIVENEDGSKTVWVGETEWRDRSKWAVGITVHPGRSVIETVVRLFNTSSFSNSVLAWANTAVHANEDYQVVFPPQTQYATFHRKNQFSEWPVSRQKYVGEDYTSGVDVSRWKNHSRSTSFFAWGNKGNFVSGYDHGKEAGTIIFGNKYTNPGKKLWSWGNNPSGLMWSDLLTDEDGPYIELMFGSFSDNQPDYSWMHPQETKESTYYFAPIRNIKRVKEVNEDAMVNLELEGAKIFASVNALRSFENARVVISGDQQILLDQVVNLSPDTPFTKTLKKSINPYDATLTVLTQEGDTLISYSPQALEEEEEMPKPVKGPRSAEEINDPDSLYIAGLSFEQFHDPHYKPVDYYKKAIKIDPNHLRSNLRTGINYLKAGRYRDAIPFLKKVADRVSWDYTTPEDAESLYYLALAYKSAGEPDRAYPLFYKASWDYEFKAAAHYQMALIQSRKSDYTAALEHLEQALSTNSEGLDILALKTSLLNLTNQQEKALTTADQVLNMDPLNAQALYEKAQVNKETAKLLDHVLRNYHENYLELAVDYGNAGLYDRAIAVLKKAADSEVQTLSGYPMIWYYLGYYHDLKNDRDAARSYYKTAASRPQKYNFPFRFESINALETAHKYDPGDANAWHYLGNVYYDHQPEEAVKAWKKALEINDQMPVVHRNLAFAYANYEHDLDKAADQMKKAIDLNPQEPRYFYELDLYAKAALITPEERIRPFEQHPGIVVDDVASLFHYVELLTLTGKKEKAIELMKEHQYRRWEGGESIYPYWIYNHIVKSQESLEAGKVSEALNFIKDAVSYPKNLETVHSDWEYVARYLEGDILRKSSGNKAAQESFKKAAKGISSNPEARFFAAKASEALGQNEQAKKIYSDLIKSGENELERQETLDFFDPFGEAKSGNQLQSAAYHKMALGYLGLGEAEKAESCFSNAIKKDPAILSFAFKFKEHTPGN